MKCKKVRNSFLSNIKNQSLCSNNHNNRGLHKTFGLEGEKVLKWNQCTDKIRHYRVKKRVYLLFVFF